MRRLHPAQKVVFTKRSPSPPQRTKVFIGSPDEARSALLSAREAERDAATEQVVRYFFELHGMLEMLKRGDFPTDHNQHGSFD